MISNIRHRWLSGQEAARYLCRSDEWLRKKVNANLIPYSVDPTNNRKIYDRFVLDQYIKPIPLGEFLKS